VKRLRQLFQGGYSDLIRNVGSRLGALIALAIATFAVARGGGPAAVGVYVLLRVLPSLLGVMLSLGLPGAITYFVAGAHRGDRRIPFTVLSIAFAGGLTGAVLWLAASPVVGPKLFAGLPHALLLVASLLVVTRVLVATAKSCSQGSDDLPGANRVILTEELMFLPMYGILMAAGVNGYTAVVAGLLLADAATLSLAWGRLLRRGFFRGAARPSKQLARAITSYGLRAQTGGVISLLNLRLDFILLTLLTGPAVLGVYAVASKFAELVKIPGMSMTYVLYPRFAKAGGLKAPGWARSLVLKAGLATAVLVAPLWMLAGFVIPAVYGAPFEGAVLPAQIILLGLILNGVGAVITALLYGIGRPGLNSLAMGAGLLVTVVLNLLLIPRFHETGAAIASAIAYTVTTLVLIRFLIVTSRATEGIATADPPVVLSRPGLRSSEVPPDGRPAHLAPASLAESRGA
jgi:O-antigen/teichoic acid export membrane protein